MVFFGFTKVNMFKDNGEVLHFVNPKVQASLSSNIFAISGHSDTKRNLIYNYILLIHNFKCNFTTEQN